MGPWVYKTAVIDPKSQTLYPRFYFLSFFLFACALLSKSVTASLPATILLIVWWKRGRIVWRDVWPLIPMFVMGLAMSRLTSYMERTYVGASGPAFEFSWAQRLLIAGKAVWFYAWKLIWPARLAFIYPKWRIDPAMAWQWIGPIAAILLVIIFWSLRCKIGRGPLTAILFFGGTLVPAAGVRQRFADAAYSFVADHFQYLAGIGLIVLVVRRPRHV